MNIPRTTDFRPRTRRRSGRIAAVAIAGSLLFAACGDDDSSTAVSTGDDSAQSAQATDSGDSAVDMMGAFGPACGAVPAEGDGSFAGMAELPAASAASANPLLSTLVDAVTQAGLVDTLNGDGPFTIFAPTNDAFAAIPAETLETVLGDEELLTSILTYHVVVGESLDAEALGAAASVESFQGESVELGADGTTANGVNVVCSDVPTANATVHIIDQVLLPPTVVEAMSDAG